MSSSSTRRFGARSTLLTVAVTAGLASAGITPGASAASSAALSTSGITLGVVGDIATVQQRTGQSFALHRYGTFEGSVPTARMLSVRSNSSWRTTAAASSGSTAYKNIARWADTIKARGSQTFVAFHHEPELDSDTRFGTAADFISAYRRVVNIFRERGATNVVFTWQMTAWAFRTDTADRQYAAKWYPGDAYVDVVGGDGYNWYTCGHGLGRWVSLKTLMDPIIAFAKSHGKQAALPEFGVVRDSRRAAWLADAGQYLAANDAVVAAAFYFQNPPTNPANMDCTWPLTTTDEFSALGKMAASSTFAP